MKELSQEDWGHVRYGSVNIYEDSFPRVSSERTMAKAISDRVTVMANTLNALLGVAVFAMPWGFQQSGILGGIVILWAVGLLSFETARILLVSQKALFETDGVVRGYPEMAECTLGPIWSKVVQITTVVSCLGGCTGYVIFFGQTLGQAFSLPTETVIFVSTLPLILLSWIKSFKELSLVTAFGVFALVASVIILLMDGASQMHDVQDTPLILPASMLTFAGSATFLFTIHYCVLSIGEEWLKTHPWVISRSQSLVGGAFSPSVSKKTTSSSRKQDSGRVDDESTKINNSNYSSQHDDIADNDDAVFRELSSSIAISYAIAATIITIVGACGYVMYRDVDLVRGAHHKIVGGCNEPVCQNVILNISPGILRNCVGVTMSLVIGFSYLVILAPAREHIEEAVIQFLNPQNEIRTTIIEKAVRTGLVLLNVIVAVKAPFFGGVLGAVGGLTDAFLCFVLPPLIYRNAMGDDLSPMSSNCYVLITVFGVIIVAHTVLSLL